VAERAAEFMADSRRMYESTNSLSDLAGVEDTDARRCEVATFGRRSSTTVVRGDGTTSHAVGGMRSRVQCKIMTSIMARAIGTVSFRGLDHLCGWRGQ